MTFKNKKRFDFITLIRIPISFVIIISLLVKDYFDKVVPLEITSMSGFFSLSIIICGVLIRAWSAGTIKKSQEVSRSGPYSIVRHPLYLGSFLIALGFCLLINDNISLFVLVFLALLIYLPKVIQEEMELTEKFGAEYLNYKKEVSAIIPLRLSKKIFTKWDSSKYIQHREWKVGITCLFFIILLELISMRILIL